jgi:D-galactarolactone cycloisomerase
MRIAAITTHILEAPLRQPFAFSQWWYGTRRALLVEVVCDDGVTGWGECYGPPGPNAAVLHELTPLILGQDAQAVEQIWELCYNRLRDYGQKGVVIAALSGLDIALWDAQGKRLGVPIYRLFGGPLRSEVSAYATGLYKQASNDLAGLFAEEAAGYVAQGFRAVKMKVGFGVREDVGLVRAVRAAIGPDVALMIDANHAYDAVAAVQLGRQVADQDIGWFEEPVPPEDVQGYVEVRRQLPMPIAGGECEFTRWGFRELLARRAVDIVQPDTCSAGGLSECRKIAALASAYGVRYVPHCWGTGIALAAALQLLAVLPPNPLSMTPWEPLLEFDCTEHPIRQAILAEPLLPIGGRMRVPDGPGLGITVERAALEHFRVGT